MREPFVLTAFPTLLSEGEFKGHLEFVTFIATDGFITEKWTSVNVGTYAEDFSKIVSPLEAHYILQLLSKGETVVFPGFWALEEIKHKFGGAGND